MFKTYRKLNQILDHREKKIAALILFLTSIVAIIEVLGVASIMPFMAVLANPDVIQTNTFLSFLYEFLNFQSNENFLFFLGVSVLVFLVGSTFLRAFSVWAQIYYANFRYFSISSRLVSYYLQRPYEWFLNQNSAQLASSIIEEVSRVVHGSLYPILRLISHALVVVLILTLFLLVNPTLAISTFLFLGLSYGAIFKFASKKLAGYGTVITDTQNTRLQAIQEAFSGIKDVKVNNLEAPFLEKYRIPTKERALNSIYVKTWAEIPSFGMQALVYGGMMGIILFLMKTMGSLENSIPVLAMYALGAYKIMPSLQEMYKQLAEIKGSKSALDALYQNLKNMSALYSETPKQTNTEALGINESLVLQEIQYSYPKADKKALNNLNLEIKRNQTVGFVGSSGSGKTTTVDIILGLLEPGNGKLLVDGKLINKNNLQAWRHTLGYVPQQIFLSDDSIAANIAFGIPHNKINVTAVENAAKAANLHEFIIEELSKGYDTLVGERGTRLSGGQRQRIGIARALYHNPEILILDEATSALDNITERAVMDAVSILGHKKTIILIAHRLSTVQSCDKIFLFDHGEVVASGNYEELLKISATFKEMALNQK